MIELKYSDHWPIRLSKSKFLIRENSDVIVKGQQSVEAFGINGNDQVSSARDKKATISLISDVRGYHGNKIVF